MWKYIAFTALALPALALSSLAHADDCRFQAPRNAGLDLAGVHTLVIEVHQHQVRLQGIHVTGSQALAGHVRGRACASASGLLPNLQVTQRRDGDRLIVEAIDRTARGHTLVLFGSAYRYLDLNIEAPASLAVEMDVGSGDAAVIDVAALKATVGSGDLDVRGVQGHLEASVNSGELKVRDAGDAHVGSVGSGDLVIDRVRGTVTVDRVGSGDLTARDVQGDLRIGHLGSGDASVQNIAGSVVVDSVGSGDLQVKDVRRDLRVAKLGSGAIEHTGVAGKVAVPAKD